MTDHPGEDRSAAGSPQVPQPPPGSGFSGGTPAPDTWVHGAQPGPDPAPPTWPAPPGDGRPITPAATGRPPPRPPGRAPHGKRTAVIAWVIAAVLAVVAAVILGLWLMNDDSEETIVESRSSPTARAAVTTTPAPTTTSSAAAPTTTAAPTTPAHARALPNDLLRCRDAQTPWTYRASADSAYVPLSVGVGDTTPATHCNFAQEVANTFGGGSGPIDGQTRDVRSPNTGKTYPMTCRSTSSSDIVLRCHDGNTAVVYFYY